MLLSIVKEYEFAQSRMGIDPYAHWSDAVRRLCSDWERGLRVEVERLPDYLHSVPDDQRDDALLDIVAEHLRLAWGAGQGDRLESYMAALGRLSAQFASPTCIPAELVEDEFLARYAPTHGDTPKLNEYRRRFPQRQDVLRLLEQRLHAKGRYVRLQELGRGAMGDVFEAYDHHLGRHVAIKRPRPDSPKLRRAFDEEARVTARLDHPAIVTIHEYYEYVESPLYVMRKVTGAPLSEHIRDYHHPPADRSHSEQRLKSFQLLQSLASVCEAIAYAHAQGVLHRDLKPDNILVGEFGEVAVLDWGLAARTSPVHAVACAEPGVNLARRPPEAGEVAGTPQYMPPEQADGLADARSDVFGLGAILYEIVTGRSPHAWPAGSRPADWLQVVRDARFPAPRSVRPMVPRDLEAICLKALARDPLQRYDSASDLAGDLRRHLAGEPVAALVERSRNSRWRRWLPWHGLTGRPLATPDESPAGEST